MSAPASFPPGWKDPDLDGTRARGRRAKAEVASPEVNERRQQKEDAKTTVRHLAQPFRDGHNVLREAGGMLAFDWKGRSTGGRFAKETAPRHKRPKRIPWDKRP